MRRREFITLLGGSAAAWPIAARGQQAPKVYRIGFIAGAAPSSSLETNYYGGFLQGMRQLGYVEGRDFVVEWRFAEGRYELFFNVAEEFARLKVDIIVTGLGTAVPPMQQINNKVPIVMGYSVDPVGLDYVDSLARPGRNTTGLSSAVEDIMGKQVDLLKTAIPNLNRFAVLTNPGLASRNIILKSVEAAAKQAGISVVQSDAQNPRDIEKAFDAVSKERVGALIVFVDGLFMLQRHRIVELANERRLPSMFGNREYVAAGGLMSYGDSIAEFYRRSASFVDKIIKGAKPGDLPIEQPTRFNLVINRKTADLLGVSIPPQLYIFADEVIE
jgi:putative ABC transport system substrate-binding protein